MSVFNIDVMDNSVRDSFLIELKREMGLVGDENLSQDIDENLSQDMFPNKQFIIPILTISDSENSPSETGCDGDENLSQDNSVRDSYVEDIMNNNELPPLEKDETMQWYSARIEAKRLAKIELKRGAVGDENVYQVLFPNKQQSQDMFPTEEHVFVPDSESTQDMFPNKQQSQDMFPTEEHVFVQDSESTQDMFPNKHQRQDMFSTGEHLFVSGSQRTQSETGCDGHSKCNRQFHQLHDEMVKKYWSATPERSQTLKEASKDFLRFCAIVVQCRNEELMESISEWEQSQIQEQSDIDE